MRIFYQVFFRKNIPSFLNLSVKEILVDSGTILSFSIDFPKQRGKAALF